MSGGSLDYAYQKTERFAEKLRERLEARGNVLHGRRREEPEWDPETRSKLYAIARLADYAAAMMMEAEWLYSGDTSEETFLRRTEAIKAAQVNES